jgi:hypothetical protein
MLEFRPRTSAPRRYARLVVRTCYFRIERKTE